MSGKVLAVSHNLNLEGASLSMFELMSALADEWEIEVVALAEGPLREHYERRGIRLLELPFDPLTLRSTGTIGRCIDEIARLVGERGAELLYANTLLGYPAVLAAERAGVPSLWNIRESQSMEEWRAYLGERLDLALGAFRAASMVVFVADATRDLWRERVALGPHRRIHNGLNTHHFAQRSTGMGRGQWRERHGISPESIVFLCPGTLHERKGQRDLIEAVLRLPSEPEPVAVLLGDCGGEYSASIHGLCADLPEQLRRRVRLLPREYYVGDAYAAAEVFVCCSRNESYPRVILEALASGLPVVSTSVFGINEQVEWGVSALGYEPADVNELVLHLRTLQSMPDTRAALASAARERFAGLSSFPAMVRAYAMTMTQLTRSETSPSRRGF